MKRFTVRIQRMMALLATAVATALLLPAPVYAWNAKGHRATAEIAFNLLLPGQQANVDRILRTHPRYKEDFAAHMPDGLTESSDAIQAQWIFEQAAVWPDMTRDLNDEDKAKFHRGSWHYINLPIYLEDRDEDLLQDKLTHNMSTEFSPPLRQNLNVVQALKGNLQVWNDLSAPDSEKAVALCWILHLVGDLHQPLHTVALFSRPYYPEGDRGGNSINIAWDPEPINLHAVWDGMPNRFDDLVPSDLTLDLLRSDIVTESAIDFWPLRHLQLAKVFVYTGEVREQLLAGLKEAEFPAVEVSEFYLSTGALLAKEQVIVAGHRIAGFLE